MFLCISYIANFNSIKVQLKRDWVTFVININFNFNSIKVQLKPFSGAIDVVYPSFQFHKGTIKTTGGFAYCSN